MMFVHIKILKKYSQSNNLYYTNIAEYQFICALFYQSINFHDMPLYIILCLILIILFNYIIFGERSSQK